MGTPESLVVNLADLPINCECFNCQRYTTLGDYTTEVESQAALVDVVRRSGAFRIYEQVRGQYVQNLPYKQPGEPRIDVVLMPTVETTNLGWNLGPVGIECKRSGMKIGRPIAQMLDYRRALFNINNSGAWVHLSWVFLWPMSQVHGEFASVMAQSQVGGVHSYGGEGFALHGGQHMISSWTPSDGLRIRNIAQGRKVGSR